MNTYIVYFQDKALVIIAASWEIDYRDKTLCFKRAGKNVACFNVNNIIGVVEDGYVEDFYTNEK